MYLNALTGRGVHLITPTIICPATVPGGWSLYNKLGLKAGVIMEERGFIFDPEYEGHDFEDEYARRLKQSPKQQVYQCDVVYGTNHQFGFDYLRDNMSYRLRDMVQTNRMAIGGAQFAVVDEVDFVLIDVARTR